MRMLRAALLDEEESESAVESNSCRAGDGNDHENKRFALPSTWKDTDVAAAQAKGGGV